MKLLIVGAGEVGYNLAKILVKENHDVILIDSNSEKCRRINEKIDAQVIHGDGQSQRILQDLKIEQMEYVLALTGRDEVNLIVSKTVKNFGAERVICRLRNTEYRHRKAKIRAEDFGIDYVTYPEISTVKEIELLIRQSSAVEVTEIHDGALELCGIKIENSSPLVGRSVANVERSYPFVQHKLISITRDEKHFVANQNSEYKKGDIAYFLGRKKDIPDIKDMVGKFDSNIQNVMILGGGKVGRRLAKNLQSDYSVRLIDQDKENAQLLSETLEDSLILCSDGTDIEFLESENIREVDCFVAVTNNEETNILSSLLAKHMGAKQVITHINSTTYIPAVRRIGVDAVVCKNISAVNDVMRYIRSKSDMAVTRYVEFDVESFELTVSPYSKYVRKKMSIEKIPKGFVLGAIFRENTVEIPKKHSVIYKNDSLLLFGKPTGLESVRKIFE